MRPRDTTYRLVCDADQEASARAFLAERMEVPATIEFPVIVAERHGRIIGVLATRTDQGAIVAGPLAVEGRSPFTAMRLIEAYDRVMQSSLVTRYHFHVAKGNDKWRTVVERFGVTPFHEDEQGTWYRRDLPHAA